ncbi:MAG TPA: methyl-accepting chemotaxis protein [Symbiobacteriaceae bacterium]|nr:methyl-accepting chemotaxis protein [Symbiobacteriaceae bacterium]
MKPAAKQRGRIISIGTKLTLSFLIMLLLVVGSSGWSYFSLTQIQQRNDRLMTETYPLALTAKDLYSEVLKQAQLIMSFAVAQDFNATRLIKESQTRADELLAVLKSASQKDASLAPYVEKISEKRTIFDRMIQNAIDNSGSVEQFQLILTADNARNMGTAVGAETVNLVTALQEQVRAAQDASRAAATSASAVLILFGLASAAIGLVVSWVSYRTISLPLRSLATQLGRIAEGGGDLTAHIKVTSRDEIGLLAGSFNKLVEGLADMVRRMITISQEIYLRSQQMAAIMQEVSSESGAVSQAMAVVASGSQAQNDHCQTASHNLYELNQASDQIAKGAQHQAMRAQETTSIVQDMVHGLEQVAATASQMNETYSQAAAQAREGARIVDDTLDGMHRVHDRVQLTADRIRELGRYGGQIGEMLQVITEIATQTNLLALNAAIEAARAGAQGRGFAVVAEEVRQLAERSATSVKEIRLLVNNIHTGTQQAVEAITQSTLDVEHGVQLSNAAGTALGEILEAFEQATQGVQTINGSIQLMLHSSHEVSRTVQEMAAITQENSASSEEMAAGANQVSRAMEELSSVSATNTNAVDQVAVSMSRVSDSVGTIFSSVSELNEIATSLQNLVAQFKV